MRYGRSGLLALECLTAADTRLQKQNIKKKKTAKDSRLLEARRKRAHARRREERARARPRNNPRGPALNASTKALKNDGPSAPRCTCTLSFARSRGAVSHDAAAPAVKAQGSASERTRTCPTVAAARRRPSTAH